MLKRILLLLSCGAFLLQAQAATNTKTATDLNYAMGYRVGLSFKHDQFPLQSKEFMEGMQTGYAGMKPSVSPAKMEAAINAFRMKLLNSQKEKMAQLATTNLKAGQAFLAKNKKAAGVKTLPDGLQYKIIKAGTGNKPTAKDKIEVNYQGTLIDGTVFDSSYKRGTPASFRVDQVIPGWTQALQLMKEGATWILYIPAELAYGEHGMGPIPPNSVLIFKVNLIKILR